MLNYQVYILYSKKLDRFYVGHTSNLGNRLNEHNTGESSYTSSGIPWNLIWSTIKESMRQAEDLEFKLKNLSKERKISFMNKYHDGVYDTELFNSLKS